MNNEKGNENDQPNNCKTRHFWYHCPPSSGWRQCLLLNVTLMTSKQEPQSNMLSENVLPISSQLSCNSIVSWIIIKTKLRKLKLLPPMELPSPSSVILYWGVRPAWWADSWRGSCCSLQSPLSPSQPLILHSPHRLFLNRCAQTLQLVA